jgi:hypothetical protein
VGSRFLLCRRKYLCKIGTVGKDFADKYAVGGTETSMKSKRITY